MLPQFPLTRSPNCGPDQIRLRLLGGTSALRATLSKVQRDVSDQCPFGCCAVDDLPHVLLHCKGLADLKKEFRSQQKVMFGLITYITYTLQVKVSPRILEVLYTLD